MSNEGVNSGVSNGSLHEMGSLIPSLAPIDVEALMHRVADRDQVSFAGVYDATVGRAYNVALEVVRDPVQAGAAIVVAYREIWEFAHAYVGAGQRAESWVMAIVHRIAVEHARRDEQEPVGLREGSVLDAPPPTSPRRWPSGVALSQAEREVLELSYFGGYTHAEVDALMRLSPGSSKRHLRNGLRELFRVTRTR